MRSTEKVDRGEHKEMAGHFIEGMRAGKEEAVSVFLLALSIPGVSRNEIRDLVMSYASRLRLRVNGPVGPGTERIEPGTDGDSDG